MNALRFALTALAGTLLTAAAPRNVQEDAAPARSAPQTLRAEDLELRHYTPRSASIQELFRTLESLYGRSLLLESENGASSTPVPNMTIFGSSLILYDTPRQVQQLLAALEHLEQVATGEKAIAAERGANPNGGTVVAEYQPRFLELRTVRSALAPFVRTVQYFDDKGTYYQQENLSFVQERAVVVMRDTSANVAQMTELLEKLDRPAPQVMLTAQLVLAKDDGNDAGLPRELVDNLAQLVGYEHFETIATSTIRTSVGLDQKVALQLSTPSDTYELVLQCAAFDRQESALTIGECRLEKLGSAGGRLFATACVIGPNEFTVLGSSGPTPLFAVVRMVPLAKN